MAMFVNVVRGGVDHEHEHGHGNLSEIGSSCQAELRLIKPLDNALGSGLQKRCKLLRKQRKNLTSGGVLNDAGCWKTNAEG